MELSIEHFENGIQCATYVITGSAGAQSVCYEGDADYEAIESQQLAINELVEIVNEQADDEGLWCEPVCASEAYIQSALRRLHEVIEGKSSKDCALEALNTHSLNTELYDAVVALYNDGEGDYTDEAKVFYPALIEKYRRMND